MTSKSPLLVTGGAGYVGSHTVLAFREAGFQAGGSRICPSGPWAGRGAG